MSSPWKPAGIIPRQAFVAMSVLNVVGVILFAAERVWFVLVHSQYSTSLLTGLGYVTFVAGMLLYAVRHVPFDMLTGRMSLRTALLYTLIPPVAMGLVGGGAYTLAMGGLLPEGERTLAALIPQGGVAALFLMLTLHPATATVVLMGERPNTAVGKLVAILIYSFSCFVTGWALWMMIGMLGGAAPVLEALGFRDSVPEGLTYATVLGAFVMAPTLLTPVWILFHTGPKIR
jgi:hypothetical protein